MESFSNARWKAGIGGDWEDWTPEDGMADEDEQEMQAGRKISPRIERYLRMRRMPVFRFKVMVKGSTRYVFVQTDRRSHVHALFQGKTPVEVVPHSEQDSIKDLSNRVSGEGFRPVLTAEELLSVCNAIESGIKRRQNSMLSEDELVIFASVEYMQSTIRDSEKQAHQILTITGEGWFRIVP